MQYRTLGKTSLKVSEVGIGTWQLADDPDCWVGTDLSESLKSLYKFVELGGNFVDTAWGYGYSESDGRHRSEELIGKFLLESNKRDQLIIASKVPPKNWTWPAFRGVPISEIFPPEWITKCVDDSLASLGLETIDLMQFHVWQDDFADNDDWKTTIQKITQAGKVKYWGISVNDYQPSNCLKTLDTGLISTIQFIFNIFHQKPTEKLLPYAAKNNIGLIARVPRDEGSLTGRLTLNSKFDDDMRSKYFSQERLKEFMPRIEKLEQLLGTESKSLPELALRYILSFDEVSTVIPGTRKVKYVDANVSASDGHKLSDQLMKELKKHVWERNFYVDLDPALKSVGYIEK